MLFSPPTFPRKKISKRGLSLVELLIAVSIFSVVSIAIYSTFSSGATVLRRAKNIDLAFQKGLLKIERLERDLRQMVLSRKPLFFGESGKISFSGVVDDFPCRLTYYFDNAARSVMRNADKLTDIITVEGNINSGLISKPAIFLTKVKELKFYYLYFDLKQNAYSWVEKWEESVLPLAVKISLSTESGEYVTTVFIPVA